MVDAHGVWRHKMMTISGERQHSDGAPSQRAKACWGRGTYTITVTPENKGLLKDTMDFSQYKSDSPSRPARGGKTHLMIYHEKK